MRTIHDTGMDGTLRLYIPIPHNGTRDDIFIRGRIHGLNWWVHSQHGGTGDDETIIACESSWLTASLKKEKSFKKYFWMGLWMDGSARLWWRKFKSFPVHLDCFEGCYECLALTLAKTTLTILLLGLACHCCTIHQILTTRKSRVANSQDEQREA